MNGNKIMGDIPMQVDILSRLGESFVLEDENLHSQIGLHGDVEGSMGLVLHPERYNSSVFLCFLDVA